MNLLVILLLDILSTKVEGYHRAKPPIETTHGDTQKALQFLLYTPGPVSLDKGNQGNMDSAMDHNLPSLQLGPILPLNRVRRDKGIEASATSTEIQKEDRLYFDGLDCRNPSMVRNGLVSDICKGDTTLGKVDEPVETVTIVQHSTKRITKAYKCKKRVTRLTEVCGAFSHSKILGPPDILQAVPFSAIDCQQTIQRGIFHTETGESINIDVNREYSYKYIKHGKLSISPDNVACQGASVTINGEQHNSIVSLVTANIEFLEIEVEVDTNSAIDLDSNIKLPSDCIRRNLCVDGHVAYVISHPENLCPLYIIRTLPMKKVKLETNKGPQVAYVSREHKILLIIKPDEATDNSCDPVRSIGATQYPNIKILHHGNTPGISLQTAIMSLGASELDLDLEIISSVEYEAYDLEQKMSIQMHMMGTSLCTMSKQTLYQAEISPFHPDSLIRVRGDIIQELKCEIIVAEARLGDNRGPHCYKDSIPVWVRNTPLFMMATTGLIVDESTLTLVPCQSQYNSIFLSKSGRLVQADPTVSLAEEMDIQDIESGYLHALDNAIPHHTEFSGDFLYEANQLDAFNQLVHFGRAKTHVLDSLVRQYCYDETGKSTKCGSYVPGHPGEFGFDLSQLEKTITEDVNWAEYIQHNIEDWGGYCSIVVVLYLLVTFGYKIVNTFILKCYHKEDWTMATKLNFFTCSQANHKIHQGERNNRRRGSDALSENGTEATFDARSEHIYMHPRPRHQRSNYSKVPVPPNNSSNPSAQPPPAYSDQSGGQAQQNFRYDYPQPQPRVYPDAREAKD